MIIYIFSLFIQQTTSVLLTTLRLLSFPVSLDQLKRLNLILMDTAASLYSLLLYPVDYNNTIILFLQCIFLKPLFINIFVICLEIFNFFTYNNHSFLYFYLFLFSNSKFICQCLYCFFTLLQLNCYGYCYF